MELPEPSLEHYRSNTRASLGLGPRDLLRNIRLLISAPLKCFSRLTNVRAVYNCFVSTNCLVRSKMFALGIGNDILNPLLERDKGGSSGLGPGLDNDSLPHREERQERQGELHSESGSDKGIYLQRTR